MKCLKRSRVILMAGLTGVASLLCGCVSSGTAYMESLELIVELFHPKAISFARASKVPYASLGVRVNGSQEGIAVLATDSGGERMWLMGKTTAITTDHDGRVLRTSGLPYNLSWSGAASAQRSSKAVRYNRSVDFADLGVFGVQITCIRSEPRLVTIKILGHAIVTQKYRELCVSEQLSWHFQNEYWMDRKTQLAWRSVQYIHPKLGPIEIETFRPAS